jgi:ppGpp synthetase/RelA/SpoT-type nucleotidyltranferase
MRRRKEGPGSNGTAAIAASETPKPTLAGYPAWLQEIWQGDTRELREGRFLHQQADLRLAFETSAYWREVSAKLYGWSRAYSRRTEALLFQVPPARPVLFNKPWDSFLNRTWRENINRNRNWPAPPEGGWWLPDNWFERAWDIVRTRFVVRYLDGAKALAEELEKLARQRQYDLQPEVELESKEDGYYAIHVALQQRFSVTSLDYEGTQERTSGIEIQVMTALAEVVSQLTHVYYEARRESVPSTRSIWDPSTEDRAASDLFRDSSKLEQAVMDLRERIRQETTTTKQRKRKIPVALRRNRAG